MVGMPEWRSTIISYVFFFYSIPSIPSFLRYIMLFGFSQKSLGSFNFFLSVIYVSLHQIRFLSFFPSSFHLQGH